MYPVPLSALSGHLSLAPAVRDALLSTHRPLLLIGASGWMGSATLAILDEALSGTNLQRVTIIGSRSRLVILPSGRSIPCGTLDDLPNLCLREPLVLHFAYATKDKVEALGTQGFLEVNRRITNAVCDAMSRFGGSLFHTSSGAVYSKNGGLVKSDNENVYGYSKLEDEFRYLDCSRREGWQVCTARLFTLSGEYINKTNIYVLAVILIAALKGDIIRLSSGHQVWRSYAYVGDLINLAVFELLGTKDSPQPFDVAGETPIEIGALADLCRCILLRPNLPIIRPAAQTSRPDCMLGDSSSYIEKLAMAGVSRTRLGDQVAATANFLRHKISQ